MKNRIRLRKLGRTSSHRKALFRNMVTSLLEHERIKTTVAKAKELRRIADRVVTWAKEGTPQYRVKALGYVRDKELVRKLFEELGPRYQARDGGYSRVLRTGYRTGDRAPMALIEYVDRPGEVRVARNASYEEGKAALGKAKPRGTPSPAARPLPGHSTANLMSGAQAVLAAADAAAKRAAGKELK